MTQLLIDTSDNTNVTATLTVDDKQFKAVSNTQDRKPESIIKLIDDVCQKAKITINDVDEINVDEGPGSYTGLKVGVSVANALSFALGKRVNGREIGDIVEPKYD